MLRNKLITLFLISSLFACLSAQTYFPFLAGTFPFSPSDTPVDLPEATLSAEGFELSAFATTEDGEMFMSYYRSGRFGYLWVSNTETGLPDFADDELVLIDLRALAPDMMRNVCAWLSSNPVRPHAYILGGTPEISKLCGATFLSPETSLREGFARMRRHGFERD